MSTSAIRLSVIIPVLNEADNMAACLQSLTALDSSRCEIIVVDGGSEDATVELASAGARVIRSEKGRSRQMNAGASQARGEVLLFLHADTHLPHRAEQYLFDAIHKGARWGRFDVRLTGSHILFRVIERMMNWRSCLTSVATGDQAMFVQRELFEQVGGFPPIALMEDIALSKLLRRHQRAACIHHPVLTSSRRWQCNGIVRTVLLMWRLRLMYFFGVPADKLAALYRQ